MDNDALKTVHKIYENDSSVAVYAADDVFSTVIGMAAADTEGVLGLSDLNTGELVTKINSKTMSRCLRFDFGEEQNTVLVGIIVIAGCNLLKVSTDVQNKVMAAVKDVIGFQMDRVNIQITDVRAK